MDIKTIVGQFAAQHPFYYGAAAIAFGAFGPKVLVFLKTDVVDWAVKKYRELQRKFLIARGVTPEQLARIEAEEADALRRAADDIQKQDAQP